MINCHYSTSDETEIFKSIIKKRKGENRAILNNLINRINQCYDQYLNQFPDLPTKLNSEIIVEKERKALLMCYTSKSDAFAAVRAKIFNDQPEILKSFCPYCLIDKPKTLDHYISKDEFPEYATMTRNLVPCCYDCNQKKGELWRHNNSRMFIHFYNDTFIKRRFLYAEIHCVAGMHAPDIKFSIKKSNEFSDSEFEIIASHFEELKLLAEYSKRVNTVLSSEISLLKEYLQQGITEIQLSQNLSTSQDVWSRQFGINYYQAVMYEAMRIHLAELLAS